MWSLKRENKKQIFTSSSYSLCISTLTSKLEMTIWASCDFEPNQTTNIESMPTNIGL